MTGLAAPMIWLTLASGLAPGALERYLQEALGGHLPLEFAVEAARGGDAAPPLVVRFHQQQGWLKAFFQRPPGAPPQLWLYRPYYLDGLRIPEPVEMRLDVSEYFFHALALAYFEGLGDGGLAAELARRADRFDEVPEPYRREAFFAAAAEFASHAMSVANEVERLARRRRAAGGSICEDIRRRLPLFVLWERIFSSEPYPGSYWIEPQSGGPGRTLFTSQVLDRADKEVIAATLFAGRWSGRLEEDFQSRYCD